MENNSKCMPKFVLFRHKGIFFALILFIFTFISLPVIGQSNVENQKVTLTLNLKNQSVKKVFSEIETKTGCVFFYPSNLNLSQMVSVSVNNVVLNTDTLNKIFAETTLVFSMDGRQIYVSEKKQKTSDDAKNVIVNGNVTDINGLPIAGAAIMIKGTSVGTITDVDGNYSITVPDRTSVLQFSFLGYIPKEEIVGNKKVVNIVLVEDVGQLEEVVVIGYGQQKKESVVSSLSSIGPSELNIKQANLKDAIAGKIAGVISVQRTGEPGNDAGAFYIRGQSSYGGGVNPLVLVDGIPRSMSDIDVDEIESFTVLKDASATAVYGAEGANGVVLITSKRGKEQQRQINVNAQYNIVTPTRMIKTLSSYDYLSLYNEARWNDQGNPTNYIPDISDEVLEAYRTNADPDLYPNTQWTNLLKNRTQSQRYSISVRGGSEKNRYFVSGTYYSEDGIFKSDAKEGYNANIGLQRFNLRSNIDMDISKTTKLSVDISGQYMRQNWPGFSSDDIFRAIASYPTHVIPMYYSDGTGSDQQPTYGVENQPYNMINNSGYSKGWDASLQSKVLLEQKLDFLLKGLSVKGIISFDADFGSVLTRYKTPETYYATGRDAVTNELIKTVIRSGSELTNPTFDNSSGSKKIYIEGSINYQNTFKEKHDVTGMILYMQKESQYQNLDGLQALPYRKQSVVSRFTYGYDRRYMIEASMGMTGSENFAAGHRWGIFPAIGVAWYVSHEKFMENISEYISKLKLRASYGVTGNDDIGGTRFPYRESMNMENGSPSLGLSPGAGGGTTNWVGNAIVEGTFSMPNLSWEKERKINLGMDLGLLNGRVDFSIDYFTNRRTNILLQRRTLLEVSGFRAIPWQNFGKTTNKGIESSLVLKHQFNQVSFSAVGNLTYAKNKIIEYDEVTPMFPYMRYTGNSINKPFLYIAEGLYTPDDFDITVDPVTGANSYILKKDLPQPSTNVSPGDIKYADLNKDGKINTYDQTYEHHFYSEMPEIVYGFGFNMEWKGLFIGAFFQGTGHSSLNLMASPDNIMPFKIGKDKQSARDLLLDRWSFEEPYNQNVLFPRMHSAAFEHNLYNSTWWYRNSGFLRLKNIELGYEFEKKHIKKLGINNLRIYLQGTNLAVWDHVKYWDPELGSANSGARYPLNRTYTIGLEVAF